ncbi:MAG: nucleoside deaminase [Candidatus Paracaedibacteraceae bacterium]|nr:nucleoside deaminase [Candidatus Paracaedibacteraceae bacterium]
MTLALEQAKFAQNQDEVPIGAVIVQQGQVIASAHNLCESLKDPTAHAELLAIQKACAALGEMRLSDCELYVTLEPCAMCAGAISHARLAKVIYGAYDPKGGAIDHGAKVFQSPNCLHRPDVISGVDENESKQLLQSFFLAKR